MNSFRYYWYKFWAKLNKHEINEVTEVLNENLESLGKNLQNMRKYDRTQPISNSVKIGDKE